MFSYGQRSKCTDLLNSYNNFKKHNFLNTIFKYYIQTLYSNTPISQKKNTICLKI